MSKEYSLRVKEVLRGDTAVAEFDRETGDLHFPEGMVKWRAPVVRFLKSEGYKPKPPVKKKVVYKAPPPTAKALQKARELLQKAGQIPSDTAGAPVTATTGQPSVLDYVGADQPLPQGRTLDAPVDPNKSKEYPDAPPKNPDAGDKTPAFVNWLYENHPKDAELRYAGRKTQRG